MCSTRLTVLCSSICSGVERAHEAAQAIQETMEVAVKLKVPTVVDVEIGKNWGEMRKWG